jgi:class 3 adenylate cyclase/tetratricopeptide (TPR) repeat protein
MQCPKCQFENPAKAKFCIECGNAMEFHCPNCDKITPANAKFCMECGHDLRDDQDSDAVDYAQPQSYTPKFLADKILTDRSAIKGERKLVTVLFADVANFTSISEKLDPETVHQLMDGCFKILMAQIHINEGTINQFTGDGVMALFGAPLAAEDHALRACRAAWSIQNAMITYGKQVQKANRVEFKLRIGLNSGAVVVGAIGDDLRMDYTAVGDTTNLAARMESLADPGAVLVSNNTFKLVREFFEFESLGETLIKGKEKPQTTFKLIKPGLLKTRIEASMAKGWTKFVGRQKEMEILQDAYTSVRGGSGRVIGIVGEAGVGKSRLLLELKESLPEKKALYLEGRCHHYGRSIAYLPFLRILKTFFDLQDSESDTDINQKMQQKLFLFKEQHPGSWAPIRDALSLKIDDESYLELEPQQKRERIFDALASLFLSASKSSPLVLVIEDFHWTDKTSEAFIEYLIGWLAAAKILLILLYRPEYAHSWVSKSYYTQLNLDQLPDPTRADLVNAIFEGAEVSAGVRDLILDKSGGNPLFIEEFIHNLMENGTIQPKDNRWVLNPGITEIQIPDTIEGIIAARIDRLENTQKQILQLASVIGRIFPFRVLQSITDLQSELKSVLLNLLDLEFIHEQSRFPELEYVFKHLLAQEVAYKSLLLKSREKLHEKIGQTIEALYADRLEEFYEVLAYHYLNTTTTDKAYCYAKLSGEKAMRNNSAWEAMDQYQRAISILDRMPENAEQKEKKLALLHLLILPIITLGFPDNSLSLLELGEKISKDLEDERSLFRFHTNIGFYFSSTGNYPEAETYIEQAFNAAEKLQDINLMAQVIPDLWMVYFAAGNFDRSVAITSNFIEILEKEKKQSEFFGGPTNVYSILFGFCGMSLAYKGEFKEAIRYCDKGMQAALELDDVRNLGVAEYFKGTVLIHRGEIQQAREILELSKDNLEKMAHTPLLGSCWSFWGRAYALAGDPKTGCSHVNKGLKLHMDAGYRYLSSLHYQNLGICLTKSRDYEAAERAFKKGLEICNKTFERTVKGGLLIWRGKVLEKTQSPVDESGLDSILDGIEISENLSQRPDVAVGYLFLAELYANRGQKENAMEYLKKSMTLLEAMEMEYWMGNALNLLEAVSKL